MANKIYPSWPQTATTRSDFICILMFSCHCATSPFAMFVMGDLSYSKAGHSITGKNIKDLQGMDRSLIRHNTKHTIHIS